MNDSKKALVPVLKQMSDFGTNEPFVARVPIGLTEILDGIDLEKDKKDKIKEYIFETFQELSNAFIALRDIKEMETGKKPVLLINQRKAYFDLYGYCWKSYKDRMPKILKAMEVDIGFLFGDDKKFKAGSIEFIELYPQIGSELVRMLANERQSWQNTLSNIRNNFIEHKKSENVPDSAMEMYFNPDAAQLIFDNCWQAIEDIVVMCFSTKLFSGFTIGVISEKDIDTSCPKKYCFYFKK